VLLLSLALIDSLELNPNKAFQPILHSFGRMSAQPQIGSISRQIAATLNHIQSHRNKGLYMSGYLCSSSKNLQASNSQSLDTWFKTCGKP
jgi:hypothetical protein